MALQYLYLKRKLWIFKIPSTVAGQNLSSKNAEVLNKTSKNSRKKQKKKQQQIQINNKFALQRVYEFIFC